MYPNHFYSPVVATMEDRLMFEPLVAIVLIILLIVKELNTACEKPIHIPFLTPIIFVLFILFCLNMGGEVKAIVQR